MLDFSLTEMLVVAVLVLVFVGPDDLPKLLSVAGKYYAKLRRASDELRRAFNVEIAKVESDERREQLRRRKEELERMGMIPPADAAPRAPRGPARTTESAAEAAPSEGEAPASSAEAAAGAPADAPAPAAPPAEALPSEGASARRSEPAA